MSERIFTPAQFSQALTKARQQRADVRVARERQGEIQALLDKIANPGLTYAEYVPLQQELRDKGHADWRWHLAYLYCMNASSPGISEREIEIRRLEAGRHRFIQERPGELPESKEAAAWRQQQNKPLE